MCECVRPGCYHNLRVCVARGMPVHVPSVHKLTPLSVLFALAVLWSQPQENIQTVNVIFLLNWIDRSAVATLWYRSILQLLRY